MLTKAAPEFYGHARYGRQVITHVLSDGVSVSWHFLVGVSLCLGESLSRGKGPDLRATTEMCSLSSVSLCLMEARELLVGGAVVF